MRPATCIAEVFAKIKPSLRNVELRTSDFVFSLYFLRSHEAKKLRLSQAKLAAKKLVKKLRLRILPYDSSS